MDFLNFWQKEHTEICGKDVSENAGHWLKIERRQNADKLTYLIIGISYRQMLVSAFF